MWSNGLFYLALNNLTFLRDKHEGIGGGGFEIGEGGQMIQTSGCKISKSWGGNIQHGDCS